MKFYKHCKQMFLFSDELPEKYQSDLVSYMRITTKVAEQGMKMICGLTILDKELFVLSKRCSEIEVYDLVKLSFSHQLKLNELIRPLDISSCSRSKCLYIFNGKSIGQSNEILRAEPSGNLIRNWSTGADHGSLSVTVESNVILAVCKQNKLTEYSPDGHVLRQINLSSQASIHFPKHAIKLTNGQFMVCHGRDDNDPHGV